MPLRVMPHVGAPVRIVYLGSTVRGLVRQVLDQGRRLIVVTEDGDSLSFVLNPATASFIADGAQSGPRLRFGDERRPG